MLEVTQSTEFLPGTNVRGEVAGANWTFLLPSLELDQILSIGAPSATTLATLAQIGREVLVACRSREAVAQTLEISRRLGQVNVRVLSIDPDVGLPLLRQQVDLVLIAETGGARRVARDRGLRAEIRRVLKSDGLVYWESGRLIDQWLGEKAIAAFAEDFGASRHFWLTPLAGEMHTAVPLEDEQTIEHFLRHKLYSPSAYLKFLARTERVLGRSVRFPITRRVERLVGRRLLRGGLTRRHGVLAGPTSRPATSPPDYLCSIAGQSGADIENHRWALSATGKYRSRKVLFFLFDREADSPEYIVKMTRDPGLNYRLENEHRALVQLESIGMGDGESLPRVKFFGHHGGLAIVGQTAIQGMPFRARTLATTDCPYAQSATNWLIELGRATADSSTATTAEAAGTMAALLERFDAIYHLAPEHREFLDAQVAAIGLHHHEFPLVFQHGDPGAWNVLVTPSGKACFLDWEAAEPQGMPLWDLFYFLRSYGVWCSRQRTTRSSLKAVAQQWLADTSMATHLIDSTRTYCRLTNLSPRLVEPLFYTCWMHRALKEATRLAPADLDRGHYVNLLRMCIEARPAPALDRLFSLAPCQTAVIS